MYLLRRRLGISIAELQAMEWWEAKVYIDGLAEELEEAADGGDGEVMDDPFGA